MGLHIAKIIKLTVDAAEQGQAGKEEECQQQKAGPHGCQLQRRVLTADSGLK